MINSLLLRGRTEVENAIDSVGLLGKNNVVKIFGHCRVVDMGDYVALTSMSKERKQEMALLHLAVKELVD